VKAFIVVNNSGGLSSPADFGQISFSLVEPADKIRPLIDSMFYAKEKIIENEDEIDATEVEAEEVILPGIDAPIAAPKETAKESARNEYKLKIEASQRFEILSYLVVIILVVVLLVIIAICMKIKKATDSKNGEEDPAQGSIAMGAQNS